MEIIEALNTAAQIHACDAYIGYHTGRLTWPQARQKVIAAARNMALAVQMLEALEAEVEGRLKTCT